MEVGSKDMDEWAIVCKRRRSQYLCSRAEETGYVLAEPDVASRIRGRCVPIADVAVAAKKSRPFLNSKMVFCAKAQRGGFVKCGQIDRWMGRYALGVSLPDAPLREFETRAADLPRATEAERLVVLRIGQDIFRASLMDYWQGRCPLTGISDRPLLRASHTIPWSECESDAERLDVHNGLLLSALWDAAFDRADLR